MNRIEKKEVTKDKEIENDLKLFCEHLENPNNTAKCVDYLKILINKRRKESLCKFIINVIDLNENDEKICYAMNEIIYILLEKKYKNLQETLTIIKEENKEFLIELFNDKSIIKDWVLSKLYKAVKDSLKYGLKMFIWNNCETLKLQMSLTLILYMEFDKVSNKEEMNLYVEDMIKHVIPYLLEIYNLKIENYNELIMQNLNQNQLLLQIIDRLDKIYCKYIISMTMFNFRNEERNNEIIDETIIYENTLKLFELIDKMKQILQKIVKEVKEVKEINFEELEKQLGWKSENIIEINNNNELSNYKLNKIGSKINQLFIFMNLFQHIFDYYLKIVKNKKSNSIDKFIYTINTENIINYCILSLNNNKNLIKYQLFNETQNDTLNVHINWIDYLLQIILKDDVLQKKLIEILKESTISIYVKELILCFLQTECITNKKLLDFIQFETLLNNELNNLLDNCVNIKLIKLLKSFNEDNDSEFIENLLCFYLIDFDFDLNLKFIENISYYSDYCLITTDNDIFKYLICTLLAYLLKKQINNGFYNPYLVCICLLLSHYLNEFFTNFLDYEILINYFLIHHVSQFPNIYVNLFLKLHKYIFNIHFLSNLISFLKINIDSYSFSAELYNSLYGDTLNNFDDKAILLSDFDEEFTKIISEFQPLSDYKQIFHLLIENKDEIIKSLNIL